jgi:glycerol-3-phosphate acyltransferase PlsY
MGGLFALCPIAAIFSGEVFIIGAGLTRYASLASLAGVVGAFVVLLPLTIINDFPVEYLMYALIGALVIIYMHRDNIKRLWAGKERRLGEKAEQYAATSPTEGTE